MTIRSLRYINPYHYVAMLFTWFDNKQRQADLISAVSEANKQHKETGAKVLVFNAKKGVVVVRKKDLKKRKLTILERHAFYKTK